MGEDRGIYSVAMSQKEKHLLRQVLFFLALQAYFNARGMTLPEAIAARRFLGIFSVHRNRADMISCFLSFKSSVPSKGKQGIFFLI